MPAELEARTATMRTLWRLIQTYHAVVLFAEERAEVYGRHGLDAEQAYFATRCAPFGPLDPDIVSACMYWYSPGLVARHLPSVWAQITPDEALEARNEVFERAADRVLGSRFQDVESRTCARLLSRLVSHAEGRGRPMFAAHAHAQRPTRARLELFWAAIALRELRGDAHIAAMQSSGVTPAEGHAIMAALGLVPPDHAASAGWDSRECDDARRSLKDRGWFTTGGRLTREGRRQRALVEHETDRICAPALRAIDEHEANELTHVLAGIIGTFVTAGSIPYPNPVGIAPIVELAVMR